MGTALIAPAAGMAFVPQIVAGSSGATVPFSYFLALVGAFCVAFAVGTFASRFSSAGSFYTFNAIGLGRRAGFMSGWMLFGAYAVFFPQNMDSFGFVFQDILKAHAGISVPWYVFSIAAGLLILILSAIGIATSMRLDLIIIAGEVLVILALAIVIVATGGNNGNTLQVFNPANTPKGFSGMAFGLIFALETITGFEASATIAEECKDAQRNIPRAVIGSVIAAGIFFVFVTYALTIGFGAGHASVFANTGLPLDVLAKRYIGADYAIVVDIVVMLSSFAVSVAAGNGAVRVVYAMAREGALPRPLSRINQTRRTPVAAIVAVGVVSFALFLGLGLAVGPYPQGFSYLGAFGGLLISIVYISICVSLIAYFVIRKGPRFRPLLHVGIPAVGVVIAALPVYGSLHPLPTGAYLVVDIVLACYLVAGLAVVIFLAARKPAIIEAIGRTMASGDSPAAVAADVGQQVRSDGMPSLAD
jgi:amino acid transporter